MVDTPGIILAKKSRSKFKQSFCDYLIAGNIFSLLLKGATTLRRTTFSITKN